jgi:predicted transporter
VPSRACYVLAALLMALYVAAVVAGKLAVTAGRPNPLALGDVGEFLAVLASIAFFVTGILLPPARGRQP